MLREEIVTLLAIRLGFRTDLDDAIRLELKVTQELLESAEELPWFLLKDPMEDLILMAATSEIDLPTDFLRDANEGEGGLWVWDATTNLPTRQLQKEDFKSITTNGVELAEDYDIPTFYSVSGSKLIFAPALGSADVALKYKYYKKDDVLDSDFENGWLREAPELMLSVTGHRMAGYLQNDKALAIFERNMLTAQHALSTKNRERRLSGQSLKMSFGRN